MRGELRPRTAEIPGTAVRDGGDAARPPPARSVTLAKLSPCSGLASQPSRWGRQRSLPGREPPPCPSAGPSRSGGLRPARWNGVLAGCRGKQGAREAGNPLPLVQRARLQEASRREMPGTAGTGGGAPRNAQTRTVPLGGYKSTGGVCCPPRCSTGPRCHRREHRAEGRSGCPVGRCSLTSNAACGCQRGAGDRSLRQLWERGCRVPPVPFPPPRPARLSSLR